MKRPYIQSMHSATTAQQCSHSQIDYLLLTTYERQPHPPTHQSIHENIAVLVAFQVGFK